MPRVASASWQLKSQGLDDANLPEEMIWGNLVVDETSEWTS